MNQKLKQLLKELDDLNKPTHEISIFEKINSVTDKDESLEANSERIAFLFSENNKNDYSSWGTYFGPISTWTDKNGEIFENPSLSDVTEEMLLYWDLRAKKSKNPLMKSRYAGLVWDFSNKVLGKKPNYKIAAIYIEALILVCKNDLSRTSSEAITKITRSYNVAKSINSKKLIESCIEQAIALEERIAIDDKSGRWGFCFNLFILGKEKYLKDRQKKKLISNSENRLERVSKNSSPHICETAGIPLATYYRSLDKKEDMNRVIRIVGKSYEDACKDKHPLVVSNWYEHLLDIYKSFNLRNDAEKISIKLGEIGSDVIESMQPISHSMNIPKEELDSYLLAMTTGGIDKALNRIAYKFIPLKEKVETQVIDQAKEFPISYLFAKKLQDHKGRTVATVGGIEEDLEGNIVQQISQNLQIDSFFLRHLFIEIENKYKANTEDFLNFIFKAPIFEDTKKNIINKGITAFLEKDYITTIHILTPQIEACIRTLVEQMGGVILRINRQGGLNYRPFDDLLRDPIVENCFGQDLTFYIRTLLTDKRGWNIRNDVCHGISHFGAFNYLIADRIIHVMLCMGLVRKNN